MFTHREDPKTTTTEITVTLPARIAPPGNYILQLHAVEKGGGTTIAQVCRKLHKFYFSCNLYCV